MTKKILIIGSGGENKYEYLKWLEKLGATVILLEPENPKYLCRPKCETHYVTFTKLESLIAKAKEIASQHSISIVDTVFEMAIEPAAHVRKALGLPGLTPELVRFGRNKIAMSEFMLKHGIRNAPFLSFKDDANLAVVEDQMRTYGDRPWILRPDNLGSNIGIRRINKAGDLKAAFESAQDDIRNHHYRSFVFDESHDWILNHYVCGHELEAEVCIQKGEIIFLCPLLKTIIFDRGNTIEENRCVTPVPWLTNDQLDDMYRQIQKLVKAIYEEVMKPCGRNSLTVYVEFRIDENNHAYVLEFAFRNGGYINPAIIEASTGINPYYLSAVATLNIELDFKQPPIKCASGYQSIYSDRRGTYEGVKGIENIPGIIIKEEVPVGYEVSVPHSEILLNVIATGPTAEEVDMLLNRALRNGAVIVNGTSISIPLSAFARVESIM